VKTRRGDWVFHEPVFVHLQSDVDCQLNLFGCGFTMHHIRIRVTSVSVSGRAESGAENLKKTQPGTLIKKKKKHNQTIHTARKPKTHRKKKRSLFLVLARRVSHSPMLN